MEPADSLATAALTWAGIAFCISQSAMFSGLNLAFFSVSRMRLEIGASNGNVDAERVLALRKDSNFVLTTVLWGNVAINVLLTLLSNSVMVGLSAFLFSTFVITICGEILPQAYFSRNALRMASLLAPVLRFYQRLLWVIAKPSALMLDAWLGADSIQYMRERDLRQLIHRHIDSAETEMDTVEGLGALNFLAIDDALLTQEGELVAPDSILQLPFSDGHPQFPGDAEDDTWKGFIRDIAHARRRWMILVDQAGFPAWALDGDGFLRACVQAEGGYVNPFGWCHRPIVVTDPGTRFGSVIALLKAGQPAQSDAPIPPRIILLWDGHKRIITSSDILGRLFKGIGLYSSLESRRGAPA